MFKIRRKDGDLNDLVFVTPGEKPSNQVQYKIFEITTSLENNNDELDDIPEPVEVLICARDQSVIDLVRLPFIPVISCTTE